MNFINYYFFEKNKLLNERKGKTLEKKIQSVVDEICNDYNVDSIDVKFSSRTEGDGIAYYKTERIKGGKKNFPKFIKILNWDVIKKYKDEWTEALGHELAHHIMNMRTGSLRHTKKYYRFVDEIISEVQKKFKDMGDPDEIRRLENKIKYWKNNRKEIEKSHKEANLDLDYDKELEILNKKLEKLK